MEAGDDGRENFHARKACDYLKMAVEVTMLRVDMIFHIKKGAKQGIKTLYTLFFNHKVPKFIFK